MANVLPLVSLKQISSFHWLLFYLCLCQQVMAHSDSADGTADVLGTYLEAI